MMEVEPSPSVRRAKEMLADPDRYYADARTRATRVVSAARRRPRHSRAGGAGRVRVHAVRPREICATRFLTADPVAAERYAEVLSRDPGVLAAAVTRYILDAEGRERVQALYVDGTRQEIPHISDDRPIYANGHGAASDWAPK